MSSPVVFQSTLRFASRLSPGRSGSVSVCGLSPELVISLAGCEHFGGPLKSVFRVRVAALTSEEDDCLPDVSGRFCLHDDEVEFIPTFPFESDVKYHVTFDPAGLGFPVKEGALTLEFSVPSHRAELALTEVSHVYPAIASQKTCSDSMFAFRTRCSAGGLLPKSRCSILSGILWQMRFIALLLNSGIRACAI